MRVAAALLHKAKQFVALARHPAFHEEMVGITLIQKRFVICKDPILLIPVEDVDPLKRLSFVLKFLSDASPKASSGAYAVQAAVVIEASEDQVDRCTLTQLSYLSEKANVKVLAIKPAGASRNIIFREGFMAKLARDAENLEDKRSEDPSPRPGRK